MTEARPFRFMLGPGGVELTTRRDWTELAVKAESLGYSSLAVSDHVDGYGPWTALASAAEVTTVLRLCALVFCNDFYHPALFAREAATLDLLSEGRLELGMGAGWMAADYHTTGISFDAPAKRIERLGEAVRLVSALLSGEQCSLEGTYYQVRDLALSVLCAQKPRPPILVAGSGKMILGLAAREADIVGLNVNLRAGVFSGGIWASGTAEETARKIAVIEEAGRQRDFQPERQVVSHVTVVTDDEEAVTTATAQAWGVPNIDVEHSPHVLIGSVSKIVDILTERRERYGLSYVTVGVDAMDAFAPVVAELNGR